MKYEITVALFYVIMKITTISNYNQYIFVIFRHYCVMIMLHRFLSYYDEVALMQYIL